MNTANTPRKNSLALLTSGGDAPGMNMALWALTQAATQAGWQVVGIREGFAGLLAGNITPLAVEQTLTWARYGGTKLGTSRLKDLPNHLEALHQQLTQHNITALAILGGNGSTAAANLLHQHSNITCVSLPATIDNDVFDSDESIGFDTALNTGVRLLDGIRDTAEAMPRLFALETLGGNTGFLAHAVAEAGAADAVLVPEHIPDDTTIITALKKGMDAKRYAIAVASEGYPDLEKTLERVATALETRYRLSRAGHAQRGGQPSARDRTLALELSLRAWQALQAGESGRTVWQAGQAAHLPFADVHDKPFTYRWRLA